MTAAERSKHGINVVLFSGGSGTKSITDFLVGHPQVFLTILINCYDDGHSTGRLRRFVPGMLGPSDVRKNIGRLMPSADRSDEALSVLSDHRLPVGASRAEALPLLRAIAAQDAGEFTGVLRDNWDHLTVRQANGLASYVNTFLDYEECHFPKGHVFDYTDCALGNIYFAGCYLQCHKDFNASVSAFSDFYRVRAPLLNITRGENLFLVAEKENGSFFINEAELVALPAKIRRISLISQEAAFGLESHPGLPPDEVRRRIEAAECLPELNALAAAALDEADVIIYGPGTQHSSLLPSYLTRGVGDHIAANRGADKIFIANIRRDVDIQSDDANDLADKLIDAMRRGSNLAVQWQDCVTHFFVQRTVPGSADSSYVPFDDTKFSYPMETVRARDWEAREGRHEGGYVFSEIQQIVQSRIQIDLAPQPSLVSFIVPALCEEATVEQVLKGLMALDFSSSKLSKEVILVDGGSTDRTVEIARGVRGVKVVELQGASGRGAALRRGIEESRGNFVVFFPADNEYLPEDLYTIVNHLLEGRSAAVFGTRNTKVLDLDTHLKAVYKGHRLLYFTSKYGGLAISILTLVLFNRYVSDVLTSCKGFEARTLRSLNLDSHGVDLEAEIVAKLCNAQQYIMEVPVEFKARGLAEGKKIRMLDGLKTIWALIRYRLAN